MFDFPVRFLFAPVLSVGYMALVAVLLEKSFRSRVWSVFGDVSQMALSCYVLQNVIASLIFYGWGFGLGGQVYAVTIVGLWLIISTLQMFTAVWWMRTYAFGPLEWARRRLLGLIVTLLFMVVLLAAYYISLWVRDWRLLAASLSGCGMLCIFGIFYQEWFLLYGFITADQLCRAKNKGCVMAGVTGFPIMHGTVSYFVWGDPFAFLYTLLLPVLLLQMVIPFVIRIREKARLLEQDLTVANEKIERYIQEEERNRIARDLHDTLGQTLTMIKLKSELAGQLVEKNAARARKEMREVGVLYVQGGWQSIVDSLRDRALHTGVKIMKDRRAEEVIHSEGQVRSVRLSDGQVLDAPVGQEENEPSDSS